MRSVTRAVRAAYDRFVARFLNGTSIWNGGILLLFLAMYAAASVLLLVVKAGRETGVFVLTGFVALLAVAAVLYYGARQASMIVQLQTESHRADLARELADKLQEAFVQQPLPVVSNLGFSATYVPATSGAQIGGDWYDAFELPDGRIMFSVGDVAGHGVEAAVAMSRVRQSIIAAAMYDSDPRAILTRANAGLSFSDYRFATAICGHIDAGTLRVCYATAGHPPGILIAADGSARLLEYEGLPLGVQPNAAYRTFQFTAQPNSMLVLYTDGAIEYDHDLIEGERLMLATAREIVLRREANPAAAIQDAIFSRSKPLDDVAILTISFKERSDDPQGNNGEDWSVALRGVRVPFGETSP